MTPRTAPLRPPLPRSLHALIAYAPSVPPRRRTPASTPPQLQHGALVRAADDAALVAPDGVLHAAVRGPRHVLIGEDLALVLRICRRYHNTPLSFDELVAAGNEGLVHASRLYDPAYGLPFQDYARYWIRRSLAMAIHQARYPVAVPRDYRSTIRRVTRSRDLLTARLEREPTLAELVEHTGLPARIVEDVQRLEQPPMELDAAFEPDAESSIGDRLTAVADPRAPTEAEMHRRIDIERLLPAALERLSERERTIVSLHYGLASGGLGLSDAKIAPILGYSEERVRQLRHIAERRLRADDTLGDVG